MGKRAISASLKHRLVDKGWAVIGVGNREEIESVRDALRRKVRQITGQPALRLEDFHTAVKDEGTFEGWRLALNEAFRAEKWGHRVIAAEKDFFQNLLGADLNIQTVPSLNIARPGRPKDNIAFHRASNQGYRPNEISVLIPYADVSEASAISVVTGSHLDPKSATLRGAESVPLKFGELLLFSQALLYGSQVNVGEATRWTSDTRVVNSGTALSPDLPSDAYEIWCRADASVKRETP